MRSPELFDLSGRVGIVTGAASGLGRAIAQSLAEAGAIVVCADRDEPGARATVQAVADEGGQAEPYRVDVTVEQQVEDLVLATVNRHGRLDLMFNNAGILAATKRIDELTLDQWNQVLGVNLTGIFLGCRAAARVMIRQGWGKIVNTASIYGLVGSYHGNQPDYTAAKGGVVNFTRELANELSPFGINVNAIAPGLFVTNILRNSAMTRDQQRAAAKELAEIAPHGRIGQPDQVKGAALFLASAASDFVNGQVLVVDDGYLAR